MRVARPPLGPVARGVQRVRNAGWPVLQTTVAAIASWYLAVLVLPEDRPFFAPVAAIVALGASYADRGRRSRDLIVGVTVGVAIGALLIMAIGVGPLQLGLLVLLAMLAALFLGGGPVLVNQAAISAVLLAVLESGDTGSAPERVLEALLGGGVALIVNALLFPPNPVTLVDRAVEPLLDDLADALRIAASALAAHDEDEALRALGAARHVDERVDALEDALEVGRETARMRLSRRPARQRLDLYGEEVRQLDLAVRSTRVLARQVVRAVRREQRVSGALPEAIRGLAAAVESLGEEEADLERTGRVAREAARRATAVLERDRSLGTSAIVSQIRSTAADLIRAAGAEAALPGDPSDDPPTAELLVDPAPGVQQR